LHPAEETKEENVMAEQPSLLHPEKERGLLHWTRPKIN